MAYSNDKKYYGIIFALLPFIIAFAIAYYNSAKSVVKPYQIFRQKIYNQNPLHRNLSKKPARQLPSGQVILQKGEKQVINETCLVFKGFSQGNVNLDLYIIELDPEIPYPLSFTKESLKNGVWLSNSHYKLVSVKKNRLHLKVQNPNQ